MVIITKPYEERWSTEQVQACVDLWSLTPHQHEKLLQLQSRIKDVNHWKNDPYEVVRFLKEFRFDVATTETKFRNSIQWRLENHADVILEDYTPPALYNYFPLGVLEGADHSGQPIYIERSGAADAYGLLQRFGKDEMIRHAIWSKELLSRGPWQESWPTRITAFTTILDLKGLNRHHLNPHLIPVGQAVTRLTQDNYPGFGKKILVIRAPFLFRFVWNVFKHFVDPHVKELIEIATEQDTEALLEKYLDLKLLPPDIAPGKGQGRAVQGYETIWQGGPIPPPTDHDWKRRSPIFGTTNTNESNQVLEQELANLDHPTPLSPTTTTSDKANVVIMEAVEVMLEKEPNSLPIKPTATSTSTTSKTSQSMSSSSQSDWEKLPLPAGKDKTQQQRQAWTVTPAPRYNLDEIWSRQHFQEMALLWQWTETDQVQMHELQDRIQDVQHWKNNPHEVARFYHESRGNIDKAEHAFRQMVVYRVENNMDTYLQNYGEPNPLFHYVPCAMLRGTDKEGDAIFVDRLGSCDWHGLLKHVGQDAVTEYLTFVRELNQCPQFWKSYQDHVLGGRHVKQYTVIIDLEGLHHGHARSSLLALLKRTSRISHYYSAWVKRILIIRAPPIFRLIWPLVKGYFAVHVRDRMEFSARSSYLTLLEKYVDLAVLPSVICREGKGEAVPGYYQQVKLEGGPIPKEAFQQMAPATATETVNAPSLADNDITGSPIMPRCLLAPMPPGNDNSPSSPIATKNLLLGTWEDVAEASTESKEVVLVEQAAFATPPKSSAESKVNVDGYTSPMFKYCW